MRSALLQPAAWALAVLSGAVTHAAPVVEKVDPAAVELFEKKVRPVFVQQCYKCHSNTADKLKAGLYMDSREGLLKGGTSGPAIVPGHPEKSLLVEAIKYSNSDMQMPPKNQLPAATIADIAKWVQMGAPFPGGAKIASAGGAIGPAGAGGSRNISGSPYEQLKSTHWAWQPVKAVTPPAVANASWARSNIDKLVLAKMEANGLRPVADADKATLLRRVTFDLTGLPPTPEEVQAFLSDNSPTAFEVVVDRLLASPGFGERWGRHWLDVARYAESTGSTRNVPYTYAYRYRDWVIESFNKDKPYNRFVMEQIAGDLMPATTVAQKNEQMLGTGFLAMGVKDLNERDSFKYEMDNVDEQIDVMGRAILATTIACARCHDHKFDPIPTHDYYSLAGIFKSSEILSGVKSRKGAGKEYEAPNLLMRLEAAPSANTPVTANIDPAKQAKIKEINAKITHAQAELKALQGSGPAVTDRKAAKAAAAKDPALKKALRQQVLKQEEIDELEKELAEVNGKPAATSSSSPGAMSLAIGIKDDSRPADAKICIHGETDNLGPAVPRGTITLFKTPMASIPSNQSGRLELAQWLTSPQNPLTARVMANRVWQHLFGEGIVESVDNFGTTAHPPTNPELLDYLATDFVKNGWSVKKLIREVVLSHAYQIGGGYDPALAAKDPTNTYLWRMQPRRLEAEAIRDAMMFASGKIDLRPLNGSPVAGLAVNQIGGKAKNPGRNTADSESLHRSVYMPIIRSLVPEALEVFDFAEPALVTGNRDVTTVPTQALYLLNNSFVMDQSRAMAGRLMADSKLDDAGRIDLAHRLAFGRPATPTEKSRAAQFLGKYAATDTAKDPKLDAWTSYCQALFASAEFRYVR